ncbi:MAG: 5-(carboxyamino)imidazole ribonucleotide synthase [Gammaproteobacteria bacterium]|nr:MAG: 5-(carboxyamino)imidazole ribonucleotide synthase [Gammaproteobacteria bacterium]
MTQKIGILGGGQLGRMFLQAAYNYPFEYHVLDAAGAPCHAICQHFKVGNFRNYDDVVNFAQALDVIGIEIEHVNTDALRHLENQGKVVIPSVDTLTIIKDKGLQKQHYQQHGISTADYYLIDGIKDMDRNAIVYPFVQKLRTGGYDGKGVQVIQCAGEWDKLWDEPSVIEVFTPIAKEIAVMVVKGQRGDVVVYPSVEMVFDPELNLVDYLFSPADISEDQEKQAVHLARQVADSFDDYGIFAVELFVDTTGQLLVNETAPRVHNSGHHTIEAAYCCQFEQMLRVLSGLPLGRASLREGGAMLNLVGAPDYHGDAIIDGIDILAGLDKTYVHWYGKQHTAPGRKMGHVTLLGSRTDIDKKIAQIKQSVRVISSSQQSS